MLISLARKLSNALWEIVTAIIGTFLFVYGVVYVIGGDHVAGPSWATIRELGGVVPHAVVSMSLGCITLALLNTRWAQLALLVDVAWCAVEGGGMMSGFVVTGVGAGGWIVWLILVGPIATVLALTSPDSTLLLRIAGPRTVRGRRGGVA